MRAHFISSYLIIIRSACRIPHSARIAALYTYVNNVVAWLSGRASPSHGGGHRFKSCSDHHFFLRLTLCISLSLHGTCLLTCALSCVHRGKTLQRARNPLQSTPLLERTWRARSTRTSAPARSRSPPHNSPSHASSTLCRAPARSRSPPHKARHRFVANF